jgi:hypothetical protein
LEVSYLKLSKEAVFLVLPPQHFPSRLVTASDLDGQHFFTAPLLQAATSCHYSIATGLPVWSPASIRALVRANLSRSTRESFLESVSGQVILISQNPALSFESVSLL